MGRGETPSSRKYPEKPAGRRYEVPKSGRDEGPANPPPTYMKCFSYLRVSGKAQVEGDGFPRQRAAIATWASLNGASVVQEFVEEGVSGETDWDQRPAFQELIGAVLGNGVRVIVVENLTRLARSVGVQDTILTFLASRDVSLISADTAENITEAMASDPMKKALIQIQSVFSELEKNSLVRKLRAARKRKRDAGQRVEGRKPYGWREGEKAVIKRMEELRAEGLTFLDIASALDKEGHPTRDGQSKEGRSWKGETVRRILKRAGEAA
jgi:site-specific DNA recombinase